MIRARLVQQRVYAVKRGPLGGIYSSILFENVPVFNERDYLLAKVRQTLGTDQLRCRPIGIVGLVVVLLAGVPAGDFGTFDIPDVPFLSLRTMK